jgi:hypothetical protein
LKFHPPHRPFRDPENLFLRVFVSTLCDFTHLLQIWSEGCVAVSVLAAQRPALTATVNQTSMNTHLAIAKRKAKFDPFFLNFPADRQLLRGH